MIYAIAIDEQSICKIGYTRDATKRMAGLQTGTAYPLRLVKTREGCRLLERAIHKKLSHLRLRGEWFELTPETMVAFDDVTIEQFAGMNTQASTIIDTLGGTTVVARLMVAPISTVHKWRTIGIPASRLAHIRLIADAQGIQLPGEAA